MPPRLGRDRGADAVDGGEGARRLLGRARGRRTWIGASGAAPIPEPSSVARASRARPFSASESAFGSPSSIPLATATSATRSAVPAAAASQRPRTTRRAHPAQWRSARSVLRNRRRSARGPNDASTTGSRVRAAATETSGMRRPPYPRERRKGTGRATAARRPIATVVPLKRTARPAVAIVVSIACSLGSAGVALLTPAGDDQQGVVDRQSEPDEGDEEEDDVGGRP